MGKAADETGLVLASPMRDQREVLEAAFGRLRDRLVATCRPIVGSDAEDVVQDAYLRARSHLGQLRDPSQIDAWLMKITLNECFSRRRRFRRWAELAPSVTPPASSTSDPDLRLAIERLPTRERGFIVLRYGYGLSSTEIANLVGMREASVRSVLFRARRTLRTWLTVDDEH